jgi:hypothetical protein
MLIVGIVGKVNEDDGGWVPLLRLRLTRLLFFTRTNISSRFSGDDVATSNITY